MARGVRFIHDWAVICDDLPACWPCGLVSWAGRVVDTAPSVSSLPSPRSLNAIDCSLSYMSVDGTHTTSYVSWPYGSEASPIFADLVVVEVPMAATTSHNGAAPFAALCVPLPLPSLSPSESLNPYHHHTAGLAAQSWPAHPPRSSPVPAAPSALAAAVSARGSILAPHHSPQVARAVVNIASVRAGTRVAMILAAAPELAMAAAAAGAEVLSLATPVVAAAWASPPSIVTARVPPGPPAAATARIGRRSQRSADSWLLWQSMADRALSTDAVEGGIVADAAADAAQAASAAVALASGALASVQPQGGWATESMRVVSACTYTAPGVGAREAPHDDVIGCPPPHSAPADPTALIAAVAAQLGDGAAGERSATAGDTPYAPHGGSVGLSESDAPPGVPRSPQSCPTVPRSFDRFRSSLRRFVGGLGLPSTASDGLVAALDPNRHAVHTPAPTRGAVTAYGTVRAAHLVQVSDDGSGDHTATRVSPRPPATAARRTVLDACSAAAGPTVCVPHVGGGAWIVVVDDHPLRISPSDAPAAAHVAVAAAATGRSAVPSTATGTCVRAMEAFDAEVVVVDLSAVLKRASEAYSNWCVADPSVSAAPAELAATLRALCRQALDLAAALPARSVVICPFALPIHPTATGGAASPIEVVSLGTEGPPEAALVERFAERAHGAPSPHPPAGPHGGLSMALAARGALSALRLLWGGWGPIDDCVDAYAAAVCARTAAITHAMAAAAASSAALQAAPHRVSVSVGVAVPESSASLSHAPPPPPLDAPPSLVADEPSGPPSGSGALGGVGGRRVGRRGGRPLPLKVWGVGGAAPSPAL